MTLGEIAALAATILIPTATGLLILGFKLGKIEGCVKALPTAKEVTKEIADGVVDHRDGCPAYRSETSAVSHPPHPAPNWPHE